ncbi:MAG: hypothetical protein HZC28_19520 [Spirochaetes bacterium]|nr:hypothetical protein [Spirochaetota bacterium]
MKITERWLLLLSLVCTLPLLAEIAVEKDGFKGRVKECVQITYTAAEKFGDLTKGSVVQKLIYQYDLDGRKLSFIKYDGNGTIIEQNDYKYTGSNLVEYNRNNKDGREREVNEYNSNNEKIKSMNYSGSELISYNQYKYQNGKEIEQTRYAPDGNIVFKVKYKLDSKYRQIERIAYNADGSVSGKELYDQNGNMVINESYKDNAVLDNKLVSEYDTSNRKTKYTWEFISDRQTITEEYAFDSKGLLIKDSLSLKNQLIRVTSITTYENTTDAKGNIVNQIETADMAQQSAVGNVNKTEKKITESQFQYY